MTPHPVYLPTGEVRELRALLWQRDALMGERTGWRLRARRQLQGAGFKPAMGGSSKLSKTLEEALASPDGLPAHLSDSVQRCLRMEKTNGLHHHYQRVA